MNQPSTAVLGIDVSKATVDVALLNNGQCKHKRFMNQPRWVRRVASLAGQTDRRSHPCLPGSNGEVWAGHSRVSLRADYGRECGQSCPY